jgi:hypothetical protein
MFAILHALGMFVIDMFKSRSRLEAENLFLRHQLNVALRRAPPRFRLCGIDRALLIWMTRLWPGLLDMAQIVQPETILRWHRAGCVASAWSKWSSLVRLTCGEFFPPMRRTTIKRAPTWHYRKMRRCLEPSNGLVVLSPFRSWPGYIIDTVEYDFRKGQVLVRDGLMHAVSRAQLWHCFVKKWRFSRLAFSPWVLGATSTPICHPATALGAA